MSSRGPRDDKPTHLRVISEQLRGSVFLLDGIDTAIIGRSSSCDIQLKDLSVSRKHAEIQRKRGGEWRIRDLGSRNGIEVNGQTEAGWAILEPDTLISIGDIRLSFFAKDPKAVGDSRPNTVIISDRTIPQIRSSFLSRSDEESFSRGASAGPDFSSDEPSDTASIRYSNRRKSKGTNHPYLVGGIIGLVASAAIILAVLALRPMNQDVPKEHVENAVHADKVDEIRRSNPLEMRISLARQTADEENWNKAEKILVEILTNHPDHEEAAEVLRMVRRDKRALAEVEAAEASFDSGEFLEAELIAQGVHSQSIYRYRADDLLDLVERGERTRPRRDPQRTEVIAEVIPEKAQPEKRKQVSKATQATTPKQTVKQSSQRSRPRTTRDRRTAAQRVDPIMAEAREAFSQGRVSDARALVEAALDAGMSGANRLSRQLEEYNKSVRAAKQASDSRDIPRAIAEYTEVRILARSIDPPSGGRPGQEASMELANLHFQFARQSLQREDFDSARAHLNLALSFHPNHSAARALLNSM